jgi:ferritin-like metal-binding protein YciE
MKKSNSRSASKRAGLSGQDDLRSVFEDTLKDIYWAEKYLVKSLPKMAKAANADELKNAFEDHLEVTQEHVQRLEQVFEACDMKAQAKKCEAMEGLVTEGNEATSSFDPGPARDAALIIAGQKVEHYEIATYGSLAALASSLQLNDCIDLLNQTLNEEKEADETLTRIAKNINMEAMQASDESQEGEQSEKSDEDEEETV